MPYNKKKRSVAILLNVWSYQGSYAFTKAEVQDDSNMTGTDLCVNKPHCAAAVRP